MYLASGSLDLLAIIDKAAVANSHTMVLLSLGFVFLVVAVGFKLSLVPFHTWLPEVYVGSSEMLAGFISIVPKIAGFVVAIRVFEMLMLSGVEFIEFMLILLCIITMTFGNLVALWQDDIKKMLAFSSIAHAGFILAALIPGTISANASIFAYWFMFMFANTGMFAILWACRRSAGEGAVYEHSLARYAGMIKTHPFLALCSCVFLFSLAGVPPFSVFFGKMYVIGAVVAGKHYILGLLLVINSAIAVYYYLRVAVQMLLREPDAGANLGENSSRALNLVIIICVIVCVTAIFWFGWSQPHILSAVQSW